MGISRGPISGSVAKIYKDEAQKENPNMDSMAAMKAAREIFDKDSESERKNKLEEAQKHLEQKRAEKKASKI